MASFLEESRLLAQAFFRSQPPYAQLKASEFFHSLDRDGDGFITQQELVNSALAKSLGLHSYSKLSELLQILDGDRNGVLDFEECMTLYYMLTIRTRSCSSCGTCILKMGYTCTVCWEMREAVHATYDLCKDCFLSRRFHHPHESFLNEHEMYNLMLITTFQTSRQAQCRICGDFHNKHSPSYLLKDGSHLTRDTKNANCFVCEWCLFWQCSKCGVFFKGQICSARPAQWLDKTRFCNRCGGRRKVKIDIQSFLEELKSKDATKGCDTCNIKIQKGTLVSVESTHTSSKKKKTTSESGSSTDILDVMNNGFKSLEIGGKLCTTIVQQKDLCTLM